MLDPGKVRFREMRLDDLPLLHRWLHSEFVMEWYSKKPSSYAEVAQKYAPRIAGREPTHCYFITYGDTPIGYIQTYRITDYPDYSNAVQVGEKAAGVDVFIADPAYAHQGLGAHMLTRFLREIVFGQSDAECCIVGPEPRNEGAIRAYEKAGFTYLKTIRVPDEDEPEFLMRISRADVLV